MRKTPLLALRTHHTRAEEAARIADSDAPLRIASPTNATRSDIRRAVDTHTPSAELHTVL